MDSAKTFARADFFQTLSDQELVKAFKRGDEASFDELVRRYQSKIYYLALRMVHNQELAWDLSQETFVRAYQALPKFKERSSFYTWLFRICFNLCLSYRKKHRQEQDVLSLDDMSEEKLLLEPIGEKTELPPEVLKQRQDLAVAITNAVNQLPSQQKKIFMMRQYENFSNEEIAKILKLSIGTVKANYHHALKRLQVLLKEWQEKLL
ncbi:MAG: sigma-70 family RNA polymerase sigma factor [candidate division WOR-3 bacterium]|nr:sigma-70 family RNA polymerase sigma factor [candidate division WOR-3 bacterium]